MKRSYAAVSGSVVKSALAGVCISIATAAVLASVIALLVFSEKIPSSYIGFSVPVLHYIVIFVGCLIAGQIKREKVLYTNSLVLAALYFTCFTMTILVFAGRFEGIVTSASAGMLGALSAALISTRRANRGKRRFRKRKIC